MTIEVRQMLIRSVVDDRQGAIAHDHSAAPNEPRTAAELERLRAQLLAECKTWLAEQLRAREER